MKSIGESLKQCNEGEQLIKPKDEDELFCELLAKQLKQLPDTDKLMVKMQINSIIYNKLLQLKPHDNHSYGFAVQNNPNSVLQQESAYCCRHSFVSSCFFFSFSSLCFFSFLLGILLISYA